MPCNTKVCVSTSDCSVGQECSGGCCGSEFRTNLSAARAIQGRPIVNPLVMVANSAKADNAERKNKKEFKLEGFQLAALIILILAFVAYFVLAYTKGLPPFAPKFSAMDAFGGY
jgi:hypothetical protein